MDNLLRSKLASAIERASTFDDGGDGADAESARSVAGILRAILAEPEPSPWRPIAEAVFDDRLAVVWDSACPWSGGRYMIVDLDHDADAAWFKERGVHYFVELPEPPK